MEHDSSLVHPTRSQANWTHAFGVRVRRWFVLKLLGTTLWTWAFFVAYFHLLRFPAHAVTVVPTIALDRLIPFQPQAFVPYVSLWIYVGIAPGLQRTFPELLVYGLWAGALCATGLGIFYLWPSCVPQAVFDPMGFPGFDLIKGVDAAGNACPSMHVALALFTAIWVAVHLREIAAPTWTQVVNVAWLVAIVYSTLALKQHVVIDVVAGAVLGGAFAAASLRWRPAGAGVRRAAIMERSLREIRRPSQVRPIDDARSSRTGHHRSTRDDKDHP